MNDLLFRVYAVKTNANKTKKQKYEKNSYCTIGICHVYDRS